eukprot:m.714801 g.714801  ORF g.714801 m.714801 type:complete len:298 (+) comp22973_c0_seq10:1826-2719(+)
MSPTLAICPAHVSKFSRTTLWILSSPISSWNVHTGMRHQFHTLLRKLRMCVMVALCGSWETSGHQTARDKYNPKAMSQSNEEIIATLLQKCRELVPAFDATKVIHSFSGSRAKNSSGDWIIEESVKVPGFFQAAGIDSPGLAGSPAIAAHVVSLVQKSAACAERGLRFKPNTNFNPYRKPIIRPKNGWKGIKIDCKDDAAKNVVCKCEKVTEAEIVDAIHRPLPCLSTQAVRKRTRAGMGHCQGKFCEPRVKKIIARELGLKSVAGRPWPASSILPARWLTDEHKEALQNLATKMGL